MGRRPFDAKEKGFLKHQSPYWGLKRLYKLYARNALKRGYVFELTIEDFNKLTSKNCYYCEKPPAQKSGAYTYNGIDRKNNSQGYFLENCAPCCTKCNQLKWSKLSEGEMLAIGVVLKDFRNKNGK